MKIDAKSMKLEEWEDYLKKENMPRYRASQIFSWIHCKKVNDFKQMSDLSAQFRSKLDEVFYINRLNVSKKLVSSIDNTIKYLYELKSGDAIETVCMPYHHGDSLCISTQVGCKMGCRFCASTKAGFVRNLFPGEMLDQVYQTETQRGKPISNLVLMGIGEPLDNYENVLRFLKILSDPHGRGFSLRRVSLSTCGLLNEIADLAKQRLPITLSISLHASGDAVRQKIMPIAKQVSMEELLVCCKDYAHATGRRITYEYAMIQGLNDSVENARELAGKLKGQLCHVNLIPINPIEEAEFLPSSKRRVEHFYQELEHAGIPVTLRRRMGQDIQAACGQLRKNNLRKEDDLWN